MCRRDYERNRENPPHCTSILYSNQVKIFIPDTLQSGDASQPCLTFVGKWRPAVNETQVPALRACDVTDVHTSAEQLSRSVSIVAAPVVDHDQRKSTFFSGLMMSAVLLLALRGCRWSRGEVRKQHTLLVSSTQAGVDCGQDMANVVYLECTSGGSRKFWRAYVDGCEVVVEFGKIGSAGQERIRDCGDPQAASDFLETQRLAKIKKGYVRVKRESRAIDSRSYASVASSSLS